MAPLSVVTWVAAGSRQNEAEMRSVVWSLTVENGPPTGPKPHSSNPQPIGP